MQSANDSSGSNSAAFRLVPDRQHATSQAGFDAESLFQLEGEPDDRARGHRDKAGS
jgi:hypothetical protein